MGGHFLKMQNKWEGTPGWIIREQARKWDSRKKGGTSVEVQWRCSGGLRRPPAGWYGETLQNAMTLPNQDWAQTQRTESDLR